MKHYNYRTVPVAMIEEIKGGGFSSSDRRMAVIPFHVAWLSNHASKVSSFFLEG